MTAEEIARREPHGLQDAADDGMKLRAVTVIVTAVCFLVNLTDGFDLVAMAAAAPMIAREFTLGPAVLGALFSAALVGMALGAMFLSPLSDRFGRKRVLLFSVGLIAAAMLGVGCANSLTLLAGSRFLTGIGVGGVLGSASSLVSEFAPTKHRPLLVIISATGFTFGTIVVGPLSAMLIEAGGWRLIFFAGAALSAAAFVLTAWLMPESPQFLLSQGRSNPDCLNRANRIRARMGLPPLQAVPESTAEASLRPGLAGLLAPLQRRKTLLLWALMFASFWTSYFFINWTPQLLVLAGYALSESVNTLALVNLGGLIAALLVGAISARWAMARTISLLLFGAVIIMIGYVLVWPIEILTIMAVMFAIGFTVNGALTSLYGLAAIAYPLELRATGIGWALGVGRLGAIASPIAAGFMVEVGIGLQGLLVALAIPMSLLGAAVALRIGRRLS